MSLYHKYRPQALDEIWGNKKTVATLRNLLAMPRKDMPHAILFTGPSGCGKTTLGRIIASELKCTGRDFSEIDTADFRGIDTARAIRQKMSLMPSSQSACRVWLLDEVHKCTNDAQNALLKGLEDAPAHAYFILCTTDPQKLLGTVKSRCTPFTVQTLSEDELVAGLKKICIKERKRVDKKVLEKIAANTNGHVRAAIVALESVIDLPEKEQSTHLMELEAEESQTIELCRAVFGRKGWKEVADILGRLQSEPENIRYALAGYARAILMKGNNEKAFDMLNVFTCRKFVDIYELTAMCHAYCLGYGLWDNSPTD